MKYQQGDDITVAIQGNIRVAKYGDVAKWYHFAKETTITLRVQEPMVRDVERARLPAFLRVKYQQHWGCVEVRGYDTKRSHTYFLEPGTYRVVEVVTMAERIKKLEAARIYNINKWRNQNAAVRKGTGRQYSAKPSANRQTQTLFSYNNRFKLGK